MSELRKRHRIHALLRGPLPQPPEALRDELTVVSQVDGRVMIDTQGDLSPLLGWLATLPLSEIRVEPIRLRAVYDQYHANGPGAMVTRKPAS
jgi:ABC-2 type transport system ATP-binding protein